MISATTWVPRGFPAEFPTQYELDEGELDRISKLAQLRLDDALEDLEGAQNEEGGEVDEDVEDSDGEENKFVIDEAADEEMKEEVKGSEPTRIKTVDIDEDLKEYDLENYDAEAPDDGESLSMFSNIKSLAYYKSADEDPYIVLPESKDGKPIDDLAEEDREELQILDTDNLLLVAKTEDNLSHMEVYVYDESESNLYVHHDILLPSFPLCVEWLDVRVGRTRTADNQQGSFAAIGTFEPTIEIWNLDVIDEMYPDAILGNTSPDSEVVPDEQSNGRKKKGKKKKANKMHSKQKANDEYHVDAVLALSSNRLHRNLLASGSADKTVKLWDLSTLKCARSYAFHNDKVCSLEWHHEEGSILLTGSYDRTIVASDMRLPDTQSRRWGVDTDVESAKWDPHDSNYFYVSTEGGRVHYFDARTAPSSPVKAKPLWTLQAHDSEVSTFDVNRHSKGMLATGSTDNQVKLWNVSPTGPSLLVSRDMGVGKVFSVSWLPDKDSAQTLAVGGSNGVVQVWDIKANEAVRMAADDEDLEDEDDEEEP
ncbi:WD40-repeat-containing domain protein [Lipomyces kononenkoae]|uniref:WD40-repeat-containing domain protein n=1 Tax=Lipomyces kononenkoae TaxID=34357 RepID=A0ACC3T0D0_LIPKO